MNTLVGILFFWLRVLPFRISLFLSQGILLIFIKRYCREIEENYERFTKERDKRFWRRNALELGRNCALMLQLGKKGDKNILDGIKIGGEEKFKQEYKKGKGVIVVSLHFGPFEILPQVFAHKGYRVAITVDHQRNRWLEEGLKKLRGHRRVRLVDNISSMIRTLKRGEILGFLLDNTKKAKRVFANSPWKDFGIIKTPFILSKLTSAPIFPMVIYKNSLKPTIRIGSPSRNNPMEFFEPFIRENPEEWVWFGK